MRCKPDTVSDRQVCVNLPLDTFGDTDMPLDTSGDTHQQTQSAFNPHCLRHHLKVHIYSSTMAVSKTHTHTHTTTNQTKDSYSRSTRPRHRYATWTESIRADTQTLCTSVCQTQENITLSDTLTPAGQLYIPVRIVLSRYETRGRHPTSMCLPPLTTMNRTRH